MKDKKNQMVEVELDLEDDLLLQLCLMAHEQDITLNEFINNVLKEYIEKLEGEKNESE